MNLSPQGRSVNESLEQAELIRRECYEELATLDRNGQHDEAHSTAMMCYLLDICIGGLRYAESIEPQPPILSRQRKTIPELAVMPLLTIEEACKLTDLPLGLLLEAVAKRTLQATFIDCTWRIRRDDLDEFIKSLA